MSNLSFSTPTPAVSINIPVGFEKVLTAHDMKTMICMASGGNYENSGPEWIGSRYRGGDKTTGPDVWNCVIRKESRR